MPNARDAKAWANSGGLHGIGNSLYTPFSGTDGDDIDYDAYRARAVLRRRPRPPDAVAHERHRRVVVADDGRAQAAARGRGRGGARGRARHRDPGLHQRGVGQGLRRAHAARGGARRRHLLPADPAHGGARRRGRAALLPVRRRPHRHRVRACSTRLVGLRARPRRGGAHRQRDPGGVRDEGRDDAGLAQQGRALARARARHLGVRRHRLQGRLAAAGHRGAAQLAPPATCTRPPRSGTSPRTGTWCGTAAWPRPSSTRRASGSTASARRSARWFTCYPGRPEYFTHWGEAFRYAAAVLGLPMGDYPHSRPPQGILPEAAKDSLRKTFENVGLAKSGASV